MIKIYVNELYNESAKLSDLATYESKVKELAGLGQDVILTGAAPVWLYLRLGHALHGVARSLSYDSPASGMVKIFDHNCH